MGAIQYHYYDEELGQTCQSEIRQRTGQSATLETLN